MTTTDNNDEPLDPIAAARAARMAKFSIAGSSTTANPIGRILNERPIKTQGRGNADTRVLFVAWNNFRGAYPGINDTMLAATWTELNPKGSRTGAYKPKSISSTETALNYDGQMSTFFTAIAERPEAFFKKLAEEYGKPLDEKHTKPLIAAAKKALDTRSAAPTTGRS